MSTSTVSIIGCLWLATTLQRYYYYYCYYFTTETTTTTTTTTTTNYYYGTTTITTGNNNTTKFQLWFNEPIIPTAPEMTPSQADFTYHISVDC